MEEQRTLILGAGLTGLSCAYLILHTTFAGKGASTENSVRIWGLRGPLGAFIAAWGGFCMLTSAPFDNWWHNSFGLDVMILSPPHVVLVLGIFVRRSQRMAQAPETARVGRVTRDEGRVATVR